VEHYPDGPFPGTGRQRRRQRRIAPLPPGHGSPCIWDNWLYVTAFDKPRETGIDGPFPRRLRLSRGEAHLFVYYDRDRKISWQFPLPTSPVLVGDTIVLQRDYSPNPELLAVSRQDGKLPCIVPVFK
jgi:hypothetical protein